MVQMNKAHLRIHLPPPPSQQPQRLTNRRVRNPGLHRIHPPPLQAPDLPGVEERPVQQGDVDVEAGEPLADGGCAVEGEGLGPGVVVREEEEGTGGTADEYGVGLTDLMVAVGYPVELEGYAFSEGDGGFLLCGRLPFLAAGGIIIIIIIVVIMIFIVVIMIVIVVIMIVIIIIIIIITITIIVIVIRINTDDCVRGEGSEGGPDS